MKTEQFCVISGLYCLTEYGLLHVIVLLIFDKISEVQLTPLKYFIFFYYRFNVWNLLFNFKKNENTSCKHT